MNRTLAAAIAAGVLSVAACGSASSSAPPAASASAVAHHAAKPSPSASCTRTTSFDYIERDDDPGASITADEIGNTDYSSCQDSLTTFAAEAGRGDGECTTIARASDNPGYDVNAIPAPPLKDVIESAGSGC